MNLRSTTFKTSMHKRIRHIAPFNGHMMMAMVGQEETKARVVDNN